MSLCAGRWIFTWLECGDWQEKHMTRALDNSAHWFSELKDRLGEFHPIITQWMTEIEQRHHSECGVTASMPQSAVPGKSIAARRSRFGKRSRQLLEQERRSTG
jgi:hypothetical protein